MSQDNIAMAAAINLADVAVQIHAEPNATVLVPASDYIAILTALRDLRNEFNALDHDLKRFKVFTKTGQVDDLFEEMALIDARVAKIEGRAASPEQITTARLANLDRLLLSRNNEPMTFSEIGKVLELGSRTNGKNTRKQAMTRFSKNLDAKNYEIFSSKTRGGKMVRLTKTYLNHLRMEAVQV